MTEQIITQENPAPPENPQQTVSVPGDKTISFTKALIILILTLGFLGGGGYALGSYKFWKTYDATPYIDKMEAIYSEKAQADPENPDNYVQLGYVYFQKKDYTKATSYYQKALSLKDDNYQAHYNLGLTYVATDKKERAIEQYKKAIDIAPKAQAAHLSLGMLYLDMQQYDKAETELDLAYKADPGDAQVLYNVGLAKEKLGKKDEAIKIYQEVISFGTNNQGAKDGLARLSKK